MQYSNLEFKLLEQQKDHLTLVESLNEQISDLKRSQNKFKGTNNLPTSFNETIITELKTELCDNKVFNTV